MKQSQEDVSDAMSQLTDEIVYSYCYTACRWNRLPERHIQDMLGDARSCVAERLLEDDMIGLKDDLIDLLHLTLGRCCNMLAKRIARGRKRVRLESEYGDGEFFSNVAGKADDPSAVAERQEEKRILLICLNQLPQPLHDVMKCQLLSMSGIDSAVRLGISESCVSQRKDQAIKAIKACFKKHFGTTNE